MAIGETIIYKVTSVSVIIIHVSTKMHIMLADGCMLNRSLNGQTWYYPPIVGVLYVAPYKRCLHICTNKINFKIHFGRIRFIEIPGSEFLLLN